MFNLLGNFLSLDDDSSSSDDDDISLSDAFVKFFVAITREHLSNVPKYGNANRHLDKLLVHVRRHIKEEGYDPYEDEDLSGEIKYIYVKGLKTIKRTGAATVIGQDNYLFLNGKIGFRKFSSEVEVKTKLCWKYWIAGIFFMDSNSFDVNFLFSVRIHTDSLRFHLHTLTVEDWNKVDREFSGKNCIGNLIGCSPCVVRKWTRKNLPKLIRDGVNDELQDFIMYFSDFEPPVAPKAQAKQVKTKKSKKK